MDNSQSSERFPRVRCEHDGLLYPLDQTAQFRITRLADASSKVVRICYKCSDNVGPNFTATRVAD
jgi:hypothetical protein